MDDETLLALAFMIFGLGFFSVIMFFIVRNADSQEERRWQRETDAQRERRIYRSYRKSQGSQPSSITHTEL